MNIASSFSFSANRLTPLVPAWDRVDNTLQTVVAAGSLDTANVTERNNLYFTNARARLAVSASGSINYNNSTGVISFTQGNTDTITEGVSNLYFNNTRARTAFTAGAGIDITSGTISVASTIDYGLIDGAVTSSNDYGSI